MEGEAIQLALDLEGIMVSTRSSCASASPEPSHVLLAMGLSPELARSAIRFTLGHENTEEEIDHVLSVLPGIVERLRALSPLAREAGYSQGR